MATIPVSFKSTISEVSALPWPLFFQFVTNLGIEGSFSEGMTKDECSLRLEQIITAYKIPESEFGDALEKTRNPPPFDNSPSVPRTKNRMEELLRVLHGINATTQNIHRIAAQHWGNPHQS